jgi:hypothetical protein
VFVGGISLGSLGGPIVGQSDVWLAHFDSLGNQTWVQQIGTTSTDYAWGAAPDGSGGMYVCGETYGSFGGPSAGNYDAWLAHYDSSLTLSRYCTPSIPNSTGQAGVMDATGSSSVTSNDVTLIAAQLSQSSIGYFLTSRIQGLVIGFGGSQGNLCLAGSIGPYSGPGQVRNSGATGSFSLAIDLTTMPQPTGGVAVQSGETWHFQAWHRDALGGIATSNFTDAISISFN